MPLLSTHIFKKFCIFLKASTYKRRYVKIQVFLLFFAAKEPPQSLRDSSPKGAPFGAAAKFPATAKAVPLRADFPRPGEDVA